MIESEMRELCSVSVTYSYVPTRMYSILTLGQKCVSCRSRESVMQAQTGVLLNPLSPHDALKHYFTNLKTDLIFLQLGVLD